MAFVPLTFLFGSRNKGSDAEFKRARKSLGGLNDDLEDTDRLSRAAATAFSGIATSARTMGKVVGAPFRATGKLLDGLERRVGQFNLASIAGDMKALTGETSNLSTQLDSAFAGNAKAVKPMLAGIGKTGKELRRLTGQASAMAYSLDVSAETVGKVMVELETAGGPARKGLDALNMSTRDFVKLAEVSGIETGNLGSLLGDLQTSWDLDAKGAASTADAVLAYGQAAGVGVEALKGMTPLMEKMNGLLADAGPDMQLTGDQMKGLVIGATKLAGAYREMGATQEQAVEYGQQTAEMFVKESAAFQKALEGRGEMGDFAKNLMPLLKQWGAWGDFGQVLKVGALDATKGMVQLNQIVQTASRKGFGPADVLMRQLLGTIQEASPSMAWLAQNVNAGQRALQRFDAMSIKTGGALKQLAQDGFTTSRTLADSFDIAKQMFDQQLRAIGKPQVRTYAKEQMTAYKIMGKEIRALGNDTTWGPMLKKLSILKQMGMRGLLMSAGDTKKQRMEMAKTFVGMEAAAGAIEDISNAASPLMTTLGKFGPLGTLAGGLATWFSIPKEKREQLWKDFAPIIDKVKAGFWQAWDSIKEWWGEFKPTLWKWLGDLWQGVVDTARKYGPSILSTLWDGIKGIGSLVMDSISTALSDPKIGIGASIALGLGVAAKGGGWAGLLTGIAAGAIAEAYFQAQNLIEERKKQDERRKANLVAGAGAATRVLGKGYELQDWEKELGISAEESAAYSYGATQTTDFAAQWKQDTEAQLEMVDRNAAALRGKLAKKLGIGGEFTAEALLAGQRGVVKGATGASGQQTWFERQMMGFLKPFGIDQATGKQMAGYEQAIGTAQQTAGGQAILDAQAGGGAGQFAAFVETLPLAVQGMADRVQKISGSMGAGMMNEIGGGIAGNQQVVYDNIDTMEWGIRDMTEFHSPPKAGPLSESAGNPLYNGGVGMMNLIADGIYAGASAVEEALGTSMIHAFDFAMGKYEEYAAQQLETSTVMAQVADQMVKNLTGIGTITLTGEEKNILKASLDVPGMAGVAGAVIADGNLTRKVLERIATATEGMYDNMGGKGGKGAPLRVTLAGA